MAIVYCSLSKVGISWGYNSIFGLCMLQDTPRFVIGNILCSGIKVWTVHAFQEQSPFSRWLYDIRAAWGGIVNIVGSKCKAECGLLETVVAATKRHIRILPRPAHPRNTAHHQIPTIL